MANTPSTADRLVGTPIHILQNASHLTETCQQMSSLSLSIKALVQSLLDDLIRHEQKQQEFILARLCLKNLVRDMKEKDKVSAAAGVMVLMYDNYDFKAQLSPCISILDELITGAKSLLSRFQILQAYIDVPSTQTLRKFVTEQKAVYCAFRDKYEKEKNHNSCRWTDSPGAEYGLKPFEEIVYAWDGTIMLWDNEFGDWGWLDHYHPCRYMPGSEWGKYYHDLTHGDFWLVDQRPIVDWTHAAPAKAILGHLETEYRRADEANQAEAPAAGSTVARSSEKNIRLAASTGLAYPVCDHENFQSTTFDIDLGDVTTSQYNPPPEDVARLDELNNKVQEVITGDIPVVADVQEHTEMIYRLGR